MENNTFKSVTFGGFSKQDVVAYIERTAQEHAAAVTALEQEKAQLTSSRDALQTQLSEAQTAAQDAAEREKALGEELEQLRGDSEQLRTENEELRRRTEELEALRRELALVRPDAESYRQFRTRVGEIECEAQRRSAELEASTVARLEQLVSAFTAQYQEMMTTLDATASHVTGELRKVEVNLTQLPRAMDQTGAELKTLSEVLSQAKKAQK